MSVLPLPPATISTSALPLIAEAMQASGVDAVRAFAESGLGRPGRLTQDGAAGAGDLPLAQFTNLLQAGGSQAPDEGRMWRCGQAIAAPALAELFPAGLAARRLDGLLDGLLADLQSLQHGTAFQRSVAGDTCILTYRIIDPAIWPRSRDAEFTLAFLDAVVRRFAGNSGNSSFPVALSFEHERDTGTSLAHLAGSAPLYGQPSNTLAFPARLLETPVHSSRAQPALPRLGFRPVVTEPSGTQIVEAIYRRLGQGPLNQGAIAEDCGLSERSLRRQLDRQGQSFRALVDDARTAYALWALRETHLPVGEIAWRLGYDDQGAFARAFRRTAGMPPSRFRRQSGHD
ncbi:helix-turn-helix domain-containing protein [Stappia sp.]|uniref:AraC-like transcriptional regulator QhpR n=1 Tax=Stappia sp. TaxID=1870903 RepID=UPI003A991250